MLCVSVGAAAEPSNNTDDRLALCLMFQLVWVICNLTEISVHRTTTSDNKFQPLSRRLCLLFQYHRSTLNDYVQL